MIGSRLLIAVILWGVASGALAISLGRSQGSALLGRPLSISVLMSLDGTEAASESCVSADVFYADTRVDSSRVRASLDRTSSGQEAMIRVRSSAVVDEPVVTVHVRAGCTRVVERRYVLLADPVSPQTTLPADPASAREADARRPFVLEGLLKPPTDRATAAQSRAAKPSVRLADRAPPAGKAAELRPAAKPVARLKLEPVDLTVETSPRLRASNELLSSPATSDGQRAIAAALWKALSAEPEDMLKEAEKMRSIETDLRRLSAESTTNQLALAELRSQLHAQQQNARLWMGALFAALVVAIFGFLIWRGKFSEHSRPWWRRKKAAEMNWFGSELGGNADLDRDSIPIDSDLLYSMPPESNASVVQETPKPPRRAAAPRPSSAFRPPSSRRGHTDFALSMPHMPRALKAEELFDVQHQAEFFMSIGQPDQAVAALRNHILEDSQTSALIYLDLFNLYHQLKRRNEFDGLRTEFSRLFNAEIPSFEAYTETSQGLDAHESMLSRIVSLWPDPKVLEVIEEAVFREPGDRAEMFSLEAYRELLFLYGIAKEIVEASPAGKSSLLDFDLPSLPSLPTLVPPDSGRNIPIPGPSSGPVVSQPSGRPVESRAAVLAAVPSQRGVDIDLDMLEVEKSFPTAAVAAGVPMGSSSPPYRPATAEFGDFNLIDFELSGVTAQPRGGNPEKK